MEPLFVIVAGALAKATALIAPAIVPALLKLPPPFATTALACWLTMLAPAVLFNVTGPEKMAPRPPAPRAVTEPVFVTTPGAVSNETRPCAFTPETSIVP